MSFVFTLAAKDVLWLHFYYFSGNSSKNFQFIVNYREVKTEKRKAGKVKVN